MQSEKKRNITILIVLLIIAVIAGLAYWIWVKSIALPIKGELDHFEMETVSGEMYDSKVDTIKLISFIERDCSERCEQMFANLNYVQEKLIEYGSFGKTVEMLSVADQQSSGETLEQYIEKYDINTAGWYVLDDSGEQTQTLKKQLEYTNENEDTVYLIDVNHAVRQEYNLSAEANIEQLLDDITQLVRIHKEFLRDE